MLPDKILIKTDKDGSEMILYYNADLLQEAENQYKMGRIPRFIAGPIIDTSCEIVKKGEDNNV